MTGAGPAGRVLAFSPVGATRYGTSIRSNYLIEGFRQRGMLLGSYDSVLFSKHTLSDRARLLSAAALPLVPSRVRASGMLFFEGLPYAPNRLRTKAVSRILRLAKGRGKPVLLDFYDDPPLQARDFGTSCGSAALWDEVRSTFFGEADMITFPSETMRRLYTSQGLDPSRTDVLPNASDPGRIAYSEPARDKTIGLMTGSAPGRGIEFLNEAFKTVRKAHPDARLLMAVPGQSRGGVQADGVHIVHDVTYATASAFLARCSVVAIPHPDLPYFHMATPIKLFDAMASGKPVVTTDCAETSEIVREEGCGLVSSFEADDFADKLLALLDSDELRIRAGRKGRAAIEGRHSWEHRCEKLCGLAEALMPRSER